MNEHVTQCGSGYQVKLPNGNVVKSENKKPLEDLLARAVRDSRRDERITAAWNNAAGIAGIRYREQLTGRGQTREEVLRVRLNMKQIDWAVGRVSKDESAFLAALAAFHEPDTGRRLLDRISCADIRSLAEALSPTHAHAIAQLFVAFRDG